jgi:hypothetical protein
MVRSGHIARSGNAVRRSWSHLDNLLDEALMETFPASDPVAIDVENVELTASRHSDKRAPHKKKKSAQSPETHWRH